MSKKKPTRKGASKGLEIAEQKLELIRQATERATKTLNTKNLAFNHHQVWVEQMKSIHAALPVSQIVQGQFTTLEVAKQTSKFMSDLSEQMKSMIPKPIAFSAIAQHSFAIIEDQRKSISQILAGFSADKQLFASTIQDIERSFAAETHSLTRILGKLGNHQPNLMNDGFASRIMSSFDPYMVGIKQATSDVTEIVQSEVQRAAARSLTLLTQQSIDTAERFVSLKIDYSQVLSLPPVSVLNFPKVQFEELLAVSVDEEQKDVASTELSELAREILTILLKCNEVTDSSGRPRIFHITQRVAVVINEFPQIIVIDRRSLGDFIDELYFALYEGAGTKKLRYLKDYGGPLDVPDCDVIWRIKHFRNLWLRHDIERGSASDIEKRKRELTTDLQFYRLSHIPIKTHEFRELQLAILKDVKVMLQELLDRLTA